jgi:predicted nuclease of predicted toxin-antitoxin system
LRILFDQNVPRTLSRYLTGHDVTRSAQLGWQELKNGDLIRATEDAGFHLLMTCDLNLEHQQTVIGRRVAIVALSTNNWPLMLGHSAEILRVTDEIQPGEYRFVDCGIFSRKLRTPDKD